MKTETIMEQSVSVVILRSRKLIKILIICYELGLGTQFVALNCLSLGMEKKLKLCTGNKNSIPESSCSLKKRVLNNKECRNAVGSSSWRLHRQGPSNLLVARPANRNCLPAEMSRKRNVLIYASHAEYVPTFPTMEL